MVLEQHHRCGRTVRDVFEDIPCFLVGERSEVPLGCVFAAGDTLQEGQVVATVSGSGGLDEQELLRAIVVGGERTFAQDPAFALRVLVDIALRALSPAINDPTTAIEAVDRIESLLRSLATRDLDIGEISGSDGTLRIVLVLPTWEGYVSVALDELVMLPSISILVRRRTERLIDDLIALAPADMGAALRARGHTLASVASSASR